MSPSKKAENDKWSLIYSAAKNGNEEAISTFKKEGISVDLKNGDGLTPLHFAARSGHKDAVHVLVKAGADVNRKNLYGSTLLHLAAENGHQEIVEALIEKGADVNIENYLGYTPLHLAAQWGHRKIINALSQVGKINAKAQREKTPLHLAAENGHQEVVEDLIKKGASFNMRDSLGYTALHLAVRNGHCRVVEFLTEETADVNAESCSGHTSLHLAAERGHQGVVEILLESGADVNRKDLFGHTPCYYAVLNDHVGVTNILMEKGVDINALDLSESISLYLSIEPTVSLCKSVVSYMEKLEAVGSYISQENLRWKSKCIDSFNMAGICKWNFLKYKEELKKLKGKDRPLYNFLKEGCINKLVSIWEANVGNKFNNEESLREQYPEYADILINKANEVRKEIFLHNHKSLIDTLQIYYEYNFKDMTFTGIKNFFKVYKGNNFEKDPIGTTLANYVDLEDTLKKHETKPVNVKVFGVPVSRLDNPNTKQHRVISCCTIL